MSNLSASEMKLLKAALDAGPEGLSVPGVPSSVEYQVAQDLKRRGYLTGRQVPFVNELVDRFVGLVPTERGMIALRQLG